MNIIIIGCGKVGSELARTLVNDGHNVSVIDNQFIEEYDKVRVSAPKKSGCNRGQVTGFSNCTFRCQKSESRSADLLQSLSQVLKLTSYGKNLRRLAALYRKTVNINQ